MDKQKYMKPECSVLDLKDEYALTLGVDSTEKADTNYEGTGGGNTLSTGYDAGFSWKD